jgi:uncharacterized protein (DUF1501 family)
MTLFLSRRSALLGLTGAVTLGRASLAVAAAATDKRFVVILLRGALDGMSAVVPYGDPELANLRKPLIPAAPGEPGGLLELGGFYGLHPALANAHDLYKSGEFLIVHAAAGPYRSRSHFEAQDYMEFGADHRLTSGWLNRVAALLPAPAQGDNALAVGSAMPLLLRGPARVATWLPQSFKAPPTELYARIAALNAHDPVMGPAIRNGLNERGFTEAVLSGSEQAPNKYAFPALAAAAGRLLAADDGPRLAALEIGGWDTHTGQANRLTYPLKQLDEGIVELKRSLGPAWSKTAVVVMTEFGRTARVNGTGGTDHGTGTVVFVAGGAIAGGRVQADWPGLSANRLFENRDLQPTVDVRAVAKGVLAQHLGLDAAGLAKVFPDSQSASSMRRLVRA